MSSQPHPDHVTAAARAIHKRGSISREGAEDCAKVVLRAVGPVIRADALGEAITHIQRIAAKERAGGPGWQDGDYKRAITDVLERLRGLRDATSQPLLEREGEPG